MRKKSLIGLAAVLALLQGCAEQRRDQRVQAQSTTPLCTVDDFRAPTHRYIADTPLMSANPPPEIGDIHYGTYESHGFNDYDYTIVWNGADFGKKIAVRVERIFGVLIGDITSYIRNSRNNYGREDSNWIDIVNVRPIDGSEISPLVCPTIDLWVDTINERGRGFADQYSLVVLNDRDAKKIFGGKGVTGGMTAQYKMLLTKLFSATDLENANPLRKAIIHDYGFRFVNDIGGDSVFFGDGQAEISQADMKILDRWAIYLSKRPKVRLLVEGYADDSGTEEQNDDLASQRAQSIKRYLQERGVALTRISIRSYGATRPAVLVGEERTKDQIESAKAQNRRATFHLQQ